MQYNTCNENNGKYFIVAGIDTTRFTLNWFVCFMTAHPDIQKKCQEEIDRVIGKGIKQDHDLFAPYTFSSLHIIVTIPVNFFKLDNTPYFYRIYLNDVSKY